ncbi:stem-specific protein TSJT1-like [Magnolia sinica]|uniref:stem-specific protein TSJT1-like n=1 Tax=Magnolia sinica TaxID=86752 RepID=UPI00265AAE12|nr:stem-specific protein TSJT1-like [Magnolia sinica]
MLGIFQKAVAQPPKELNSPVASSEVCRKPTHPNEILKEFLSSHPHNSLSATIGDGAIMAYARDDRHFSIHQRLFCGYDDIYCLFFGNLNNLSTLIKQYGLTKASNEAMVVIEAYRTLRDRGPYPADQVVKDLNGSFSFLIFDSKAGTVFSALGSDGGVELFWGIAADGSVVISDDLEVVKGGCGRSFAPFPAGCMFHSNGGLMSFEHPMHKMKAMPRVDSEGVMCGASFNVDKYSRVNSMPRVGSEANWTVWESH